MYRTGHYGVALCVYAPVAFALVAAGRPDAALALGAGVLVVTPLPDYDQRVPLVTHRGATHTVAFAALVGAVLGGVGAAVGTTAVDRAALGAAGAFVGLVGVGAHLLADLLTPAGIRPLWPLSGREYSLSVTTAGNPVANYLLLAAGVLATAAAVVAGRGLAG